LSNITGVEAVGPIEYNNVWSPYHDAIQDVEYARVSRFYTSFSDRNETAFIRSWRVHSRAGCASLVRSIELMQFDEASRLSSWRSFWSDTSDRVLSTLQCHAPPDDKELSADLERAQSWIKAMSSAYENFQVKEWATRMDKDVQLVVEGKSSLNQRGELGRKFCIRKTVVRIHDGKLTNPHHCMISYICVVSVYIMCVCLS
jgi:hypothetical protein